MLKPFEMQPSDIQARADMLDDLLALPEVPNRAAAAREERRKAHAAFAEAEALANTACRQQGRPGLDTEHQPPAVRDALHKLETTSRLLESAKAAERRAKERDDQEFLAVIGPKLEKAAPIYSDIAALCIEAMQPLLDLHRQAICNNLPMPRLLGAAWGMAEAVRNMTAILNSATAPAPQNAEEV